MGESEGGREESEGGKGREERKEEGGGRGDHIHLMDSNSIHYFHNLAGT